MFYDVLAECLEGSFNPRTSTYMLLERYLMNLPQGRAVGFFDYIHIYIYIQMITNVFFSRTVEAIASR